MSGVEKRRRSRRSRRRRKKRKRNRWRKWSMIAPATVLLTGVLESWILVCCNSGAVFFCILILLRIGLGVTRRFYFFYGAFAALIAKIPCRPTVIDRGCILVAQSIMFKEACHCTTTWVGLHSLGAV